jgi:hypothetical protein
VKRPRAEERAVLLPGWISGRRVLEKVSISLSTWWRSPGLQERGFRNSCGGQVQVHLATCIIYLLLSHSQRILLCIEIKIVDFITQFP